MSFVTEKYFLFLLLVSTAYFLMPKNLRWTLLLASSYYFYSCWKVEFLLLIMFSTLIDYFCALKIEEYNTDIRKKNRFLIISLFMNLGLLFTFKYSNFFISNLNSLLSSSNILGQIPFLNLVLPVGISFYTFQTLSYTIDVYRGKRSAEKHLGIFAVYVSFFPQLVAGPIERSTKLLPQFFEDHKIDFGKIRSGLKLILWGCFKKVVIADYVAVFVNKVYENPAGFNSIFLLLATYFFSFQIYCDFSGYSDIAIGSARILGYDLMQNFNNPYFARSIKKFWQRWHISLSSWFKDYVYLPLGGKREGYIQWIVNIMVVFLLSGIWHGANWTFVIWGALHGFLYLLAELFNRFFSKTKTNSKESSNLLIKFLKVFTTFNLVAITWIFFRAQNLSQALIIVNKIFTTSLEAYFHQVLDLIVSSKNIFLAWHFSIEIGIVLVLVLVVIDYLKNRLQVLNQETISLKLIRFTIYSIAIVLIFLFYNFSQEDFIYFQF